jgi:hypothetical protein
MSFFDCLITKTFSPKLCLIPQCQLPKKVSKLVFTTKLETYLYKSQYWHNSLHIPNKRPKDKGQIELLFGNMLGNIIGNYWEHVEIFLAHDGRDTKIQKNPLFPPSPLPSAIKGKKRRALLGACWTVPLVAWTWQCWDLSQWAFGYFFKLSYQVGLGIGSTTEFFVGTTHSFIGTLFSRRKMCHNFPPNWCNMAKLER